MTSLLQVCVVGAVLVGCATAGIDVGPGEASELSTKERVELKVTVEPEDIRKARYRFGVFNAGSETRRIWFFDTPFLEVFDAGTIVRAREVDGDEDDSTIKLRPFVAADLDASMLANDDTKCETDRGLTKATPSCSMTVDQDEGEIAEVGDWNADVSTLFSSEQETMYATYGPGIPLDELFPLGPIFARVWSVKTDELPSKGTVELWYMPDATQVMEVSIKVPVADADPAMEALKTFVTSRSLRFATEQESKTRRALELLVAW